MISVLIPSRTDAYLEHLLTSMETSQAASASQVIVGDNGLSPELKARWAAVQFVDVPKPFVFARAINMAAQASWPGDHLLVLNDDTTIASPHWLLMLEQMLQNIPPEYGMISLHIDGGVGNPDQTQEAPIDGVIETDKTVCFVAVLIPNAVWRTVGPLDERFIGYGMDDNDYCARVKQAGFKLGVTGAVSVKHGKRIRVRQDPKDGQFYPDEEGESKVDLPHSSSFIRYHGSAEWNRLYQLNKDIFDAKWGLTKNLSPVPTRKLATEPREQRIERAIAADDGQCSTGKFDIKPHSLNIGCGTKAILDGGWVNLDTRALPGVNVIRDLRRGLPFADETFDHVLADNVLEHFDNEDFIFILNEINRVLKIGGTAEIIVPHASSQGAVQDPTHKMLFVPRSSLYWNQVQTINGGRAVGITANLVPTEDPAVFGDMKTEAFIRFRLRRDP